MFFSACFVWEMGAVGVAEVGINIVALCDVNVNRKVKKKIKIESRSIQFTHTVQCI